MLNELIGFIYYPEKDPDKHGDIQFFGVAVEYGRVVKWNAWFSWPYAGHKTDNYDEMVDDYGEPELFNGYDPDADNETNRAQFDKECARLLAKAEDIVEKSKDARTKLRASRKRLREAVADEISTIGLLCNRDTDVVFRYLIADEAHKMSASGALNLFLKQISSENPGTFLGEGFMDLFGCAVARAADWRHEHGMEPNAVEMFTELIKYADDFWEHNW